MNDFVLIFFLTWIGLGAIYSYIKINEYEEVYRDENKLGKALTIFLGGPLAWIFKLLFIRIEFLNKSL